MNKIKIQLLKHQKIIYKHKELVVKIKILFTLIAKWKTNATNKTHFTKETLVQEMYQLKFNVWKIE
jgi:hypothetical protein